MLPRKYAALACAIAVAGCASTLIPAPVANEVAGGEGAMVRASGVQMVARAGAWEGVPSNLAAKLTPMLVTISNDSDVPVRVRYNELMLVVPEGRVYKALPPFQIDGQLAQRTPVAPMYPPRRFAYAPYFSPLIPGAPLYAGPFPYHRPYWDRYATVLRTVDLPSTDMLARAMPEGVIEPGGTLTGFVYFPGVGDDIERVRLRADLVNAETGEMLVPLAIPFVVG